MATDTKQTLTLGEAAEFLGISRFRVSRLILLGKIQAEIIPYGKAYIYQIDTESLNDYAANNA